MRHLKKEIAQLTLKDGQYLNTHKINIFLIFQILKK